MSLGSSPFSARSISPRPFAQFGLDEWQAERVVDVLFLRRHQAPALSEAVCLQCHALALGERP
jgi:hypothetical protein